MTREEMIEQFENMILLIRQNGKDWLDERDIPILEEVIKIMKMKPCEDVISRQAVLNEIETVCFSKAWSKFRADNGSNGTRDYIINYIKQLPSSQPEIKCIAKITMTDEQVKEAFEKAKCEILAAHPEQKVIRCKDCKWFGKIGCAISIVDDSDKPTEDDFCSFSEAKMEESEDKCKNCEYYCNPDYTRCQECKAESEDK